MHASRQEPGPVTSRAVDSSAFRRSLLLALVAVLLPAAAGAQSLIANGDFAQGLTGWRVWRERGALSSVVNGTGQLHLVGSGINGGVYQQFSTGGAGRTIMIDGWWASSPTVAQGQWAEVLVINGSALPVDGQDVNGDQAGVALIYKAETWAKPAGWSGDMRQTAVRVVGSFVSAGNVATIVLKTGNPAGVTSGALFDNVVVGGPAAPPNRPPVAQATAMPSSGAAPLAVRLDGSGSSDPDGDALAYGWVFGDGQSGSGATVNHTYASAGSYTATLTVSDGKGGTAKALLSITATAPPSGTSLIANGDFSQGLSGWRVWRERGALNPVVNAAGQLHLAGSGINGGVYQQFNTGGTGRTITIDGWWASSPTVAQGQWAEVLVVNGSALPVDGQDVNGNQAGVVLVYKAETWTKPGGWSGDMRQTAVKVTGSFVSAGSLATIVLKTGNGTAASGVLFDNVVARATNVPPSGNRPPIAQAVARPSSGAAPLTVELDGTGSSDPDGDALTYAWDFGGGNHGTGATATYTYATPGGYTVTLTVSDGRGGSSSASVRVDATSTEPPASGPNLVANPSFEKSFSGGGVAESWQAWTGSGQGYWKKSSRLGRIGSGSYAGGGQVLTAVKRLNPKVILLEGNAFGMAAELRRTFPDALMVGRLYIDPVAGQYLSNPEHYGRKHAEDCLAAGRPEIEVWQGLNEPYVNDVESARRVARFEKAFSDRIQELGRKSVVFNLAVGNPGDTRIMLLPEIVATLATADYAGYHAYSSPKDQRLVGPQSAWYAHRWRFYASLYRERGLRMPPVLYTEMNEWYQWKEGSTPPGVAPSQPWEIRDDFIAFERESATDPWAVGIAIFLFGSSSGQFEGRETANEPVIYEAAGDHNWNHPADARDGVASQQFGSAGAGFTGGVVQRLAVETGVEHRLTTSLKFEAPQPGTEVVLQMGYDPSGQAADGNAGTIVWSGDLVSGERRESDIWYTSSLRFVPGGPQVSIWVSVSGNKPVRVSLDDVEVKKAGP